MGEVSVSARFGASRPGLLKRRHVYVAPFLTLMQLSRGSRSTIPGRATIEAGTVSSCRPPWLDTWMAAAPRATHPWPCSDPAILSRSRAAPIQLR